MNGNGLSVATPQLPESDRDMELQPFFCTGEFDPGYVTRSADILPKSALRDPWRHSQDCPSDRDGSRPARPAGRLPVLAQALTHTCPDLSRPYPSDKEFASGYVLSQAMIDWFDECCAAEVSDPRASPLLADQTGMPPAVVVSAGLDPLRDQARAYVAALAAAGVDVAYGEAPGTIHGFATLRRTIGDAVARLITRHPAAS